MTTTAATRRAGRNGLAALMLWLAILPFAATAQTGFPSLTGRVVDGTYGMIDVLMSRVDFQDQSGKGLDVGGILFVVLLFGFLVVALYRKRRRRRPETGLMPPVAGNPEDGPAASTRDDFNGGGGGSGGGGASGGW